MKRLFILVACSFGMSITMVSLAAESHIGLEPLPSAEESDVKWPKTCSQWTEVGEVFYNDFLNYEKHLVSYMYSHWRGFWAKELEFLKPFQGKNWPSTNSPDDPYSTNPKEPYVLRSTLYADFVAASWLVADAIETSSFSFYYGNEDWIKELKKTCQLPETSEGQKLSALIENQPSVFGFTSGLIYNSLAGHLDQIERLSEFFKGHTARCTGDTTKCRTVKERDLKNFAQKQNQVDEMVYCYMGISILSYSCSCEWLVQAGKNSIDLPTVCAQLAEIESQRPSGQSFCATSKDGTKVSDDNPLPYSQVIQSWCQLVDPKETSEPCVSIAKLDDAKQPKHLRCF